MAKNFFSNNMVQTLAQLMLNKFQQECFDIKAIASRMTHLIVHFSLYHYYLTSCTEQPLHNYNTLTSLLLTVSKHIVAVIHVQVPGRQRGS